MCACNCGGIKHEYTKEYLERKAKEKVMKALEEKEKKKDNGTSTKESNSR